ncbi:hypothetical protein KBX37_10080 [Micromonospora sp. U56]|uniref:hypothetical protein n=1 Tax=Micromonospora sp. U56 TaxID=2824900 RepID=UPI001B399727|nr:hypothetical protein [Micromonospora sp. U56]MBQ0893438.1 hypothetical protein [Micromonospora sp. U56]
MTVTTNEQADNRSRDRHSIVLDYLKTAPAVLGGLATVLAAVTALLALLLK